MATPSTTYYVSPIVVAAGVNDKLRFYETDTPAQWTATIAAGTYYWLFDDSSADMVKAIEDAINTADTSARTWAVSKLTYTTHGTAAYLLFTFTGGPGYDVYFDWDYSGDCIDATILGVDDATADATVDASWGYTSDHALKNRWDSSQVVVSDSTPGMVSVVNQHVSRSGVVTTVNSGDRWVRTVHHAYEPPYRAYPREGYTNEDWIGFIQTCNAGECVRYYPQTTEYDAYSAYSDDDGYWAGVLSRKTIERVRPARLSTNTDLYSWDVELLGYVA